jgi:hypothetical protein
MNPLSDSGFHRLRFSTAGNAVSSTGGSGDFLAERGNACRIRIGDQPFITESLSRWSSERCGAGGSGLDRSVLRLLSPRVPFFTWVDGPAHAGSRCERRELCLMEKVTSDDFADEDQPTFGRGHRHQRTISGRCRNLLVTGLRLGSSPLNEQREPISGIYQEINSMLMMRRILTFASKVPLTFTRLPSYCFTLS